MAWLEIDTTSGDLFRAMRSSWSLASNLSNSCAFFHSKEANEDVGV